AVHERFRPCDAPHRARSRDIPFGGSQGAGCSPARSSLSPARRTAGFLCMTAIDFAAFVDQLATVSGEAILPFFRTSLGVEDKGSAAGFDPVTAADRAAENTIRSLIKRNFPEHGIVGEEYGNERSDAEYVWVLDPIDGTKSFITGMPAWGSLIALTHRGEPAHGMLLQPLIRARSTADGGAADYPGPTAGATPALAA